MHRLTFSNCTILALVMLIGVGGATGSYAQSDSPPRSPALVPGNNETIVTAYFSYYNPRETNWDLWDSGAACAEKDGHKSYSWRSKYGWTAFCGAEACGLCLRLRNVETGATITGRIVDTCSRGGLELDYETLFEPLDTDGKGRERGHLYVGYTFVDCHDDDELKRDHPLSAIV